MTELAPFIILGLTSGSVYGMAGVGLVVSYKTSGVFNFAFGAIGTVGAYVFYILNVEHGVPWPVAAVIAVLVLGVVLGFGFELFAKRVVTRAMALQVVATLGLVLIVEGFFLLTFGTQDRTFPTFLPQRSFKILGAFVTVSQVIVTAVGLVLTIGLYVFFKKSRMGVAMRALVDDPDLLDLAGTNPDRVRRIAWIIGSVFALLSGVLLAQSTNLDPVVLTALVAQAFAAAAIGSFSSLPLTYAGGLVVGVLAAILTKYVGTNFYLAGIPASLPFIVLFIVLVVMPKRRLAIRAQSLPLGEASWKAPLRVQALLGVVVVAVLAVVPSLVGQAHLVDWTTLLATALIFLSLGLLVKTSGQMSLCQAGFAAIGAAAFSQFAVHAHLPWLISLILAGAVVIPVGMVIAIPAIRLSGIYLALATYGFGLLLENMFYNTNIMFGTNGEGISMPRPSLSWLDLSSDTGYYYLVLVITVVISIAVVALTRGRLGRLLRALGQAPTALRTSGTSVHSMQILVFCLSAFIAGIAGALLGGALTQVDPTSFDPTTSLTYLALIVLAIGGPPWYALVQSAFLLLIPAYVSSNAATYWLEIAFGVFAVALVLQPATREVPSWFREPVDALGRLLGARRSAEAAAPRAPGAVGVAGAVGVSGAVRASGAAGAVGAVGAAAPDRVELAGNGEGLRVDNLRVAFAGLVAVDDFGIEAPLGRISGLIGPNGAGKTTSFNAVSGLNSPVSGTVRVGGRDISRLSSAARAHAGIGRTFQQMQLYESLTVRENVALGREGALAGRSPVTQVVSTGRERREVAEAARQALEICGILHLADRTVAALSTGQRRLVELARCLAGRSAILLLDEPSSGMDRIETDFFAAILRQVVAQRGVGILLVEHDMTLVMAVCDHITVLDFGKIIFRGTAAEVTASPLVQAAYLGSAVAGEAGLETAQVAEATEATTR
jgi:ABC-type branched-subunit amino acid transport system ATPase component/branched-subunit amino acid ABC-type transport system permease component